ncbi:MAG: ORF6N domain-containing protein [Parabacteroides sp.]|nr:ORF6N domain-containing protein [Parabacteroides sp.]
MIIGLRDLAELYQVTISNLNKAVQRNIKRFPPDFMFQLTQEEFEELNLIFQNGTSRWGGTRIQLDLINKTLAELQVQKKLSDKPRNPVGFVKPK